MANIKDLKNQSSKLTREIDEYLTKNGMKNLSKTIETLMRADLTDHLPDFWKKCLRIFFTNKCPDKLYTLYPQLSIASTHDIHQVVNELEDRDHQLQALRYLKHKLIVLSERTHEFVVLGRFTVSLFIDFAKDEKIGPKLFRDFEQVYCEYATPEQLVEIHDLGSTSFFGLESRFDKQVDWAVEGIDKILTIGDRREIFRKLKTNDAEILIRYIHAFKLDSNECKYRLHETLVKTKDIRHIAVVYRKYPDLFDRNRLENDLSEIIRAKQNPDPSEIAKNVLDGKGLYTHPLFMQI